MSDDAPTVGLVGDGTLPSDLQAELATAGVDVTAGQADTVLEAKPDVVIAVGDRSVAAVGSQTSSVPVVPVDAGAGIRSVPEDAVDAIPAAVATGDWETERHTPLSIAIGGERIATAVFDVALVTAEAAHISEYEVVVDGERLDRSRADGVVVATPAGSTGYARRVQAPVLTPETGVAVAWIAPFRTDPDRWVVEPESLELGVRRDEATVDLHVDERVVQSIGPGETVSVTRAEPFSVAVLACSRNRYG